MAELITVTDEDGTAIVINLDYVVRMQPSNKPNMSGITIADGGSKYAVFVHGSPQEIAMAPRLTSGRGP